MGKFKYDDNEFRQIVSDSKSKTEVLKKFGLVAQRAAEIMLCSIGTLKDLT